MSKVGRCLMGTLESWTSTGNRTTSLSVGKAIGTLSFSRASSMSPWIEFANQMSFKIEMIHAKANKHSELIARQLQ